MSDLDHSSGEVVDVHGSGNLALSAADYDRVFAILDYCSAARTLDQLKNLLMVALHDHYRCPNTTFLVGPTFTSAFADPNPVTTGRITPILDEYQARWYPDDVFATAQSRATLMSSPAITHTQLLDVPSESATYLSDFLYRKRLHSAAVMHLQLAHGVHGLVGIFDSEGKDLSATDVAGLGIVGRQLSLLCQTLPGQSSPSWQEKLTRRQRDLAELLADGHTNDEIAVILSLSPDTVKKYVSRILAVLHVRNRAEFVKLVYQHKLADQQA
ncbi:LuxR family transcriptional regulator [Rhodococcus sp. ACPA4]|uniref:response regulator transcription factor n=1 Tax=Rhodococcus globerulus TaxID=33008 RepID=UPI0005D3F819|nr:MULTISPECIES: helix-turn-helix transcriptional regulator [Rhodococcus]NMD61082.1 helix-turn-helix transcriptional regulator [Nocardia globerula]PBC37657.1 LuxR family transcriptional regulator [Rhodococcus sp. ACPA4]PSR38725.1 LuxR family transcriptional regulator [Rhodococcus sp. AD45-ID]ROZ44073.1 LuxR family transcriptional regulator [Rhodococcus sp. WS3]RZL27326.1 MAG: LuxR family transcriptional regulator [Rhodococcus sp. (in: high G+C Gram-positive bacteria)]